MTNYSSFHSNGKLLLSGEYFVLDGAKAIGLPAQFGQKLDIESLEKDILEWKSLSIDGKTWFQAVYHRKDLKVQSTTDPEIASVLQRILQQARSLNANFLAKFGGFACRTFLEFPRLWGLGSSSTLINNIAQWAQVNSFELSRLTLGGSGYDIACAAAKGPIFYHLQSGKSKVDPVDFDPLFRDKLSFVYLNRKQNSRKGIQSYRSIMDSKAQQIKTITEISEALVHTTNLSDFQDLLLLHERIVSTTLGIPRIQDSLFKDFRGVIKSLGAWGGDFVLAASAEELSAIKNYFNKKGYQTFLGYEEMILRGEG